MAQVNMTSPVVAQEVLWTYHVASDAELEKNFYIALRDIVTDEIAQRIKGNSRIWVGREIQLRIGMYVIRARLTNITPLLAMVANATTQFHAEYRERPKDGSQDISSFISEVIRYPNKHLGAQYDALVGISDIQQSMVRKLGLLLASVYVEKWFDTYYAPGSAQTLKRALLDRYPLLILEGEVGSGKTALARSIGNELVKLQVCSELMLYVVNSRVRGGGHVGELTQNISRAFDEAERSYEQEQIPIILFIDEADALAQARGGSHTHHEDDAGVNTLIQRIDRLRGRPIAVLFATNLAHSLDNAIVRRAIAIYHFERPDYMMRYELFKKQLASIGITEYEITALAKQTIPKQLPGYGERLHRYTYSDLTQRLIPQAVELAIKDQEKLEYEHLKCACDDVSPTPEMDDKEIANLESYFPA
jgi:SpoVK/Ycf46/Vps4 family AAA+-type ATPase